MTDLHMILMDIALISIYILNAPVSCMSQSLKEHKCPSKDLTHEEFVKKEVIINLMISRSQVANDLKNTRASLKR